MQPNVIDPRFCGPKIFGRTYPPEMILLKMRQQQKKKAWDELGQAKLKLDIDFNSSNLN